VAQKNFHPGDALPGGADMAALAAIGPASTGQTIVRPKNDTATTENVYIGWLRAGFFQDSPTDGTVADIETKSQIGARAI
jgi:hypothetical protein